ncbi:MFS transporter [Pasteurellaceae bacterium Pebbles2]|nr:MFS transporter [Pasteurellaceae bacterium Pebbles2]
MEKMNTNRNLLWLITFAAAAILMITGGLRLSMGLFVQPLLHSTPLTITTISLAMAILQLMWGVSQPVTGALADRFGAYPVLMWGTLLLALGCALTPLLPSEWGIMLTIGVLIAFGSGAGSFSILISLISNRLPPAMHGMSSGIVNAGSSFGQFIFAPLVQGLILIPAIGWEGAMYVLAGVSLLVLPLSYWLSKDQNTPQSAVKNSQVSATADEQSLKQAVWQAFKDKSYILVHLGFFTCGFHIAFLVTHLPSEIALFGLKAQVASWALALIGISNIFGSLFIGWCVSRWRSKYILFYMYSSRALMIGVFLLMPPTELTYYIFAVGLGLTWLATVPPTAATVSKLFGVRYLATLFGLTLLSHQIGGFFGAYLGGWAVNNFGDYSFMWYADMILAALAALLCLPIKEQKVVRLVSSNA